MDIKPDASKKMRGEFEQVQEAKHFVTSAVGTPLTRILAVVFRRASIEHSFRVAQIKLSVLSRQ